MSIREKAIEAAARAMCEDDHRDSLRYGLRPADDLARCVERYWRNYAGDATAALNAILAVLAKPDEDMVKAGNAAYEADYEYGIDDEDMTLAFKAMIAKVSE